MSRSSEASSDFLFLSHICCVHQQACVDRTSEGKLWFVAEKWLQIKLFFFLEISNCPYYIQWVWTSHLKWMYNVHVHMFVIPSPQLFFVQNDNGFHNKIEKTENIYLTTCICCSGNNKKKR